MFQKLSSLLVAKGGETFGFRLARELEDCGKDVMAVFEVSDFCRDYENVWEWIEGDGPGGWQVNISRPHNLESGDYDVPVVVRISGPINRLTCEFLAERGQRLANRLQTEVWIGNVLKNDKSERNYEFEIEQKFTPAG
jgi:hypothetical protein